MPAKLAIDFLEIVTRLAYDADKLYGEIPYVFTFTTLGLDSMECLPPL